MYAKNHQLFPLFFSTHKKKISTILSRFFFSLLSFLFYLMDFLEFSIIHCNLNYLIDYWISTDFSRKLFHFRDWLENATINKNKNKNKKKPTMTLNINIITIVDLSSGFFGVVGSNPNEIYVPMNSSQFFLINQPTNSIFHFLYKSIFSILKIKIKKKNENYFLFLQSNKYGVL